MNPLRELEGRDIKAHNFFSLFSAINLQIEAV